MFLWRTLKPSLLLAALVAAGAYRSSPPAASPTPARAPTPGPDAQRPEPGEDDGTPRPSGDSLAR